MKKNSNPLRRLPALVATAALLTLSGCGYKQPEGEIQGAAGFAIAAERAISGLQRKVVQIDGFVVPYLQGGKGEPLVLIHGFGGSKDNFNRVAYYLTNHYTVYAIDVPGFGASTRDLDADYVINTQIDRVHEIIEKLGLKQPHIGGNSMGGWISGAYAAKYPDDVASIWFLAPAGLLESRKSEVIQQFEKTGEIVLTASNREEFEKIVDVVMFKRPAFAPGFVVEAMAARAAADQTLHQRIYKDFKSVPSDLATALSKSNYKGPALIVWGKEDRVLHVDGAAELKTAMPGFDVILMDQVGHVPMMEKPEQVAADYVKWREAIAK
ncbi:pimeloyl-ACP methyl ester carboxylesterase [Limnobacter thiooxidans]|uniref:Alpha/beta fold hydrolase n=1 Tax=Limnobacter thiooxidans TaxID=131080 RepID=A0AA86J180_9BURK|nr:alpha/beta fold hydrolase [Limnobacter sp.]MCZ8014251.1 alpha/beta fold hydrolase [Limnobacter sp.]RZS42174.1 pimeloyl-ACP methyl ester carboxylesterase [Limnobacter thiooxidans]BET26393.1 alpha/beta fold hydrolase [Limnobacter thiooxidans]